LRLIAWWMFGFAISVGLGMLLTPWLLSRIRSYITQKAEHRGEVIDEEVIEKTHLASLYVPGWWGLLNVCFSPYSWHSMYPVRQPQ
jgi:Na+/pantothenate symporter